MKISLKWLNDYLDIQDYFAKPQELANLLTAAGIEVENIENLAKTYEHVVVGLILQKGQHPNADRLSLCQVSTGEGVVHQIVCGARNHNEGDRVVVALPGAVLPGNFAIKHSKIRGVDSGGMLCSEKELGLKGESEGIVILPADAPVGQAYAQYMGFDDIVFELKVTPNRADCLSHFGLAREIGCLLGRPVKFPIETLPTEGSTKEQIALELRAADLCPRYSGRGVRGVKVGPSPEWLKKRLESVGLGPINNVVDITNYVMMELGQPMHAFDVREIKGRKIVIDRALKGEKFTTLDGTEIALEGSELTIRDGERAVALAGVIGGKNSGIQDDTTEVFLESAYFTADGVRRVSRKFGIETDSAYRFARGTNPDAVVLALNRAAELIKKIAGGTVLGDHHDLYPSPVRHTAIGISHATLVARLGYSVEPAQFVDWMKRLGCEVKENADASGAVWSVLPPAFRWDLALDMDLVEEFARLHGYQHIPETLPALATMPSTHDASYVLEQKIRRLLQGEGCLQAINYGFISRSFQERILGEASRLQVTGLKTSATPVALVNPLNEEINVMRLSLVPGLIKNVVHNTRQSNTYGRIFEVGATHFSTAGADGGYEYAQESRLAFAFWGSPDGLWNKAKPVAPVFQLKGVIENLLKGLSASGWRWVQNGKASDVPEFLHPGQAAVLHYQGKPIGFIGALHPVLADELKIRESCALAEINLEKLLAGQPKSPKYSPISRFPVVDRDVAFVMPVELKAADIEAEIRKVAGALLREVSVFDVFEGGSLEAGHKSVAFRLLFQSNDLTLEDQAINELRDKIVQAVRQRFSISIRQ